MIATFRRQNLEKAIFLAATVGLGCHEAREPASPVPGARSAGPPLARAGSPSIVGTVLVSSTGKPPTDGGVVYLEDAPKEPGMARTTTIDVYHKEFSPFISVITTGGSVTFGNKDALTHHVFSPDVRDWDTGYIQKNGTASKTFETAGTIALLCNIHPEMLGYLLVIPSTYFGKLAPDGKYAIANVPSGTYRATVWAPRLRPATQSVTVTPPGSATANFELLPAGSTN